MIACVSFFGKLHTGKIYLHYLHYRSISLSAQWKDGWNWKIIVFDITRVLEKSDYDKSSAHSDPGFSNYSTY